jgi:hypothetical protein
MDNFFWGLVERCESLETMRRLRVLSAKFEILPCPQLREPLSPNMTIASSNLYLSWCT